jgi:C4-dicarboxylate-specific signal transduction histidine kinase
VLALAFILIIVLLRFYQSKQNTNKKLSQLNAEVTEQNEEITNQRDHLQHTLEELQATQKRLIQSEKMASLGQLTAGIAHEINNPLNFVTSGTSALSKYLKHLKEISKSDEAGEVIDEMDDLLTDIRSGGTRVADVVKHLRTFNHMDKQEAQRDDLKGNMDAALTLINHRLEDRIALEKSYADIPAVKCIPAEINQVFISIINNAIDAIEESGLLRIVIDMDNEDKGKVQISISDTGSGIPESIRDKIFDPFFTTKDYGQGNGLSLSTAQAIIHDHSGTITVESQEGKGSTFTIILPVLPARQ